LRVCLATGGGHPWGTGMATGELDKGDRPVGLPPSRFMVPELDQGISPDGDLLREW
jgi:hypothetical protein